MKQLLKHIVRAGQHRRIQRGIPIVLAVALNLLPSLTIAAITASGNAVDAPVLHPSIPLLDETGEHVLRSGKPYSPKMSCGNGNGSGCHDYDSITHAGGHFEMGRDEHDDDFGKKRGKWNLLSSPGYFGGFNCMGPHTLAKKKNADPDGFVGDFGAAGFVQDCNHCHVGGGWSEKDRDGIRYDEKDVSKIPYLDGDYYNREPVGGVTLEYNNHYKEDTVVNRWDWKKSGVVEADCLICHGDYSKLKVFPSSQIGDLSEFVAGQFPAYDIHETPAAPFVYWWQTRNEQFLTRGLFREQATALLEYLDIKPESSEGKNLAHFEHVNGELTPKLDANGKPVLHWHADAFDSNGKVQIPMRKFPANDNCWQCHGWWLEQDRRGFHGFGEQARPARDAANALTGTFNYASDFAGQDFKKDIHKGAIFTENNGEQRKLENCVGCHTQGLYYKPAFNNVDLDANHNFPKGNSDIDVRRDLDYRPGTKSCEYCHKDATHLANPSKLPSLLDAHVTRWTTAGFMAGYTQGTLNKIVQTHFDSVGCETCHISHLKMFDGTDMPTFYRYRQAEDGKPKIVPFNATYQFRYYWRDKVSGRVLYRDEMSSVYETKKDAEGNVSAAVIRDPASGARYELPVTWGFYPFTAWGASFKDEEIYPATKALKRAYDELLRKKGYANADVQMIYVESNGYLVSHATRPAKDAVPCDDCHTKKQNGSYSSLVSESGILGGQNVKVMSTHVDKRLVDEGIVAMGTPYFKVTADNKLVVSMKDVLDFTRQDPSMSALLANSAKVAAGEWRRAGADGVLGSYGLTAAERTIVERELGSEEAFVFDLLTGDPKLVGMAAMTSVSTLSATLYPKYRVEFAVEDLSDADKQSLTSGGLGVSSSARYAVGLRNLDNHELDDFAGQTILLKLPYRGGQTDPAKINVLSATGGTWGKTGMKPLVVHPPEKLPGYDLLKLKPEPDDGYVIVAATQPFEALTLADALPEGVPTQPPPGNPTTPVTPTTPTPSPSTPSETSKAPDPGQWGAIVPSQDCSTTACKRKLNTARATLKNRATALMKAQAAANAAAQKAAKAGLSAAAKRKAEIAAARAERLAAQRKMAFEAAAAAVKAMAN